ncbi:MAG: IS110 family RNA-guided transposase [Gammaproteobacteria bacterium]
MKSYAAIDLHSNNSVLAVLDESGNLLHEQRYPNQLSTLTEALTPYRTTLVGVVVESTYNWYWLVDGLMEAGLQVHLAHTAAVPQYAGLKHGNDFTDARHLANLLRLGILPEGYIYPQAQRGLRDLLRRRSTLVRVQTRQMLFLHALWARSTGERLSASARRRLTEVDWVRTFSDPHVRRSAAVTWKLWQTLQTEVTALEREVYSSVRSSPELAHLQSVPGIGPVLGLTILLETGAIGRFQGVGDYASYCRCVDSQRLSNGKQKGAGNAKCGNRYLAWAYIEAANYALRYSPPIRRWYDRKRAKHHRMVALKAVAHKLARACYHLLRDQADFDVQRAFA